MADYRKMYYTLFNAMSQSSETMLAAMQKAEEIYMSDDGEALELARPAVDGELTEK